MKDGSKYFSPNRPFIGLLLIALYFASNVAFAGSPYVVQAKLVNLGKNSAALEMTVWNCSNRPLTVQLANMPWGEHATGIVVYVAGKVAGVPLEETPSIEDFPVKSVEISPKASTSGRLDLIALFPEISKYVDRDNLVVFWVYDLSLIQGGNSKFIGGMATFSPSGSGKKFTNNNPCH